MVWHGAGVYYRSGLAFRDGDPVKGRQLFDQGISQMNEAVGLNPENLFVRVPRGAVLLTGTRFMADQRMARPYIEMGLGDYQKAYDFQQPTLDRLGVHPRGELIFGMAEASSRLGRPEKAEPLFRQLAVSLPGTEYAARAALWFQNRSLPVERTGCVGCHFEPGR
jgi:tetratricopeptide (TPR) repeat protein